jgi:hypothetical protein
VQVGKVLPEFGFVGNDIVTFSANGNDNVRSNKR